MKNWTWGFLVFVVSFLTMKYLKLSFLQFILIAAPLLAILMTYLSFTYSFRPSLAPEPVPEKGYETRIEWIENEEPAILRLGFNRTDMFYLKLVPDAVIYAYKHQTEPVYFCLYHLGSKMSCDFVSRFINEFSVTTCNNVDGGMVPRPPRSFIQIFPRMDYANLMSLHKKAITFMESRNLKSVDIKKEMFREYFMKSMREFPEHVRKIPFWPVMLIWWTITKRGKVHIQSIEDQVRKGIIQIM